MSELFTDSLPTPRDSFDDQLTSERAPEVDYFDVALHHPVPETETLLTTAEMADIRREPAEDVTAHFMATLLLRLAGNDIAVSEFHEYHAIRDLYASLQSKPDVTKKKLESTEQYLDEIAVIAQPYLQVYGRVLHYTEVVNSVRMGDSPYTPSQFFGEIYDRTEHMEHPGITFIRSHQTELRETSIEAERLLRLMLLNPDL